MIIINLSVLHRGIDVGKIIGNPNQMELLKVMPNGHSPSLQPLPPVSSNPPAAAPKVFPAMGAGTNFGGTGFKTGGGGAFGGPSATSPMGSSPGARGTIYPIASLNPYQNK